MDKDLENVTLQRSVPRRCVCANQPINFVTQNVTTVNLAVTSEFNYDLIMLKEILYNLLKPNISLRTTRFNIQIST